MGHSILRLRVRLAGDKGVAREFSSTAATLWNAIDRLHDEFERNRGKHSGKLPYVRLAKLEQVRTLLGVVFSPMFEIISWVVRPSELTVAPEAVADPADVDVESRPRGRNPRLNKVAAAAEWLVRATAAALCSSKETCHAT